MTSSVKPARRHIQDRPWWQTALLLIGLVSLLSVLGALFFAVGNNPAHIVTSGQIPPLGTQEFTTSLSKLVNAPVEHGGTVEVLNNGDEFLPELLSAIRSARRSINFNVYIWSDGIFSDQVLSALVWQQSNGVAVRVLLDDFGALKAPDRKFDGLTQAGGQVHRFRTPKFGKLTRFHRRNHRRSIVIDGEVGFTGGMAVSDVWLGHAQDPDHWRDMMFKVTGPLARSLQAGFADAWVSSSGEILVGRDFYPPAATAGGPAFIHHVNSPADDDQSMAYFFLLPILAAQERIAIATPYFVPDKHLKRVLMQKARAGIDVRLMLPGPHIDNKSSRFSGQSHYEDLLEAGVRVFEYQPTFMHAKVAVIDGVWSIIGSPNLNSRSRELDEENAFGLQDRALAARLEQIFQEDVRRSSEIRLDEWRRRGLVTRGLQLLARLIDRQS